jgi:CDP-4-dehydro-6-deoxyglucose reductase, E1
MKYPLATSTWDQAELDAINRVVSSGMCTMGENVLQFEKDFSAFVGSKYAVMVNSGSSANLIMVGALFFRERKDIHPGDEVIVPAVSWPTTYYPLSQYGLKLKFVDIDLQTLNYDLDALRAAIDDRTKLIMAVNLLGNPNDFEAIQEIVGKRDITIIEDNCESLGAVYKGRQTGTFGLMGSFSTFFSHHMSTMEGGVVVTDDEELYHILLCLRAHGWTRNLPKVNRVSGVKSDDPFEESFKFILPGYNVRPLEIEGALGIEQLKKLPSFLEHRRGNAKLFVELFGKDDRFVIQKEIGSSSWFGFAFVSKPGSGIERKKLAKLLMDNGIECRPIVAGNFAKNRVVSYMNHVVHGELKNAELIDSNGLFVGNHQYDISENLRELKALVDRC